MKRRIVLIIIVLLLLTGCKSSKTVEKEESKKNVEKEIVVEEEIYKDENVTPIGFYRLTGNTLQKINSIRISPKVMEDIGIYQVYPSNDDSVILNNGFGNDFYNTYIKYDNNPNKIKMGFNIKYKLTDGTSISHTILNPSMTNDKYWEYLLVYLYDDYANSGKSFYSHIEPEEYNDNTLFTAIKIQASGNISGIDKKIDLTVFTYDTEDDFDESGEYRGNSKNTLILCINSDHCE